MLSTTPRDIPFDAGDDRAIASSTETPRSLDDSLSDSNSEDVGRRDRVIASLSSGWKVGLLLAVLPVLVLVALQSQPYYRLHNGDPFVYTGYANDFRGHIERFGYTYHSVRFGLIFPLRASLVLGPVWGYFLLRWLLYMVAIVPLYFVVSRWGRRAGVLSAVLFVANPVTAGAILTTHPDTAIVPYFTASTCLLVLAARFDRRRMIACAAAAGIFAGLALNSQIFFGPLMVISITVAVASLFMFRRRLDSVIVGAVFTVAVLAVCAAGAFWYKRMFGSGDIWSTTLQAVRDVKGDPMWEGDYLGWVQDRRYIYVPLIVLVFAAIVVKRTWRTMSPDRLEQTIIIGSALAVISYYTFYQFVLGGSALKVSFYFSYTSGPTVLALGAAIGWSKVAHRGPAIAVFAVPIALVLLLQSFSIGSFLVYAAISIVVMLIAWRTVPIATAALTIAAIALAWGTAPRSFSYPANAGFQFEPRYEDSFGKYNDTAFEVYLLASQLPSFVPSDEDQVRPLLFWYRSFSAELDAVQATYHWQTSTVQRIPHPGLPEIAADDIPRLQTVIGGHVVMIGDTTEEIDQAITNLSAAGFDIAPAPTADLLQADDSAVYVRTVEVLAGPPSSG